MASHAGIRGPGRRHKCCEKQRHAHHQIPERWESVAGIVPSTSVASSVAASACLCLGWRLPFARTEALLPLPPTQQYTHALSLSLSLLRVNNLTTRLPCCVELSALLPLARAGTF